MNNERKELAGWLVKKVEAGSCSLSPWRERVRVRGINLHAIRYTNDYSLTTSVFGKLANWSITLFCYSHYSKDIITIELFKFMELRFCKIITFQN